VVVRVKEREYGWRKKQSDREEVGPSVDSSPRVFNAHSALLKTVYPAVVETPRAAGVDALRHTIVSLDQLRRDLTEGDGWVSVYFLDDPTTADQWVQRELNLACLLRLIDLLRAGLRLVLIRVLSGLSRRPGAINFALALLASARCFGHRGESGDFALPALASISVGTG
jgi:hypothetical protein